MHVTYQAITEYEGELWTSEDRIGPKHSDFTTLAQITEHVEGLKDVVAVYRFEWPEKGRGGMVIEVTDEVRAELLERFVCNWTPGDQPHPLIEDVAPNLATIHRIRRDDGLDAPEYLQAEFV